VIESGQKLTAQVRAELNSRYATVPVITELLPGASHKRSRPKPKHVPRYGSDCACPTLRSERAKGVT
jgi:hypothetical protein